MTTRCGKIAIVGRPNVGKSTLLNRLIGQKISITAPKPQTTRQQIMGIKTSDDVQMIYVDTPGVEQHPNLTQLQRWMHRAALSSLRWVDLIVFMLDRCEWKEEEERWLTLLKKCEAPVIAVVNKVDRLKAKTQLLPYLALLSEKMSFLAIVPMSAKDGTQVLAFEKIVRQNCPEGPYIFPQDAVTDRERQFLVSELVREQIVHALGDELPYTTAVNVDIFREKPKVFYIAATIWVEKIGQKKIVIGEQGGRLRFIGSKARLELEQLLGKQVFLQLWVKVKAGWTEDEHVLKELGLGFSHSLFH